MGTCPDFQQSFSKSYSKSDFYDLKVEIHQVYVDKIELRLSGEVRSNQIQIQEMVPLPMGIDMMLPQWCGIESICSETSNGNESQSVPAQVCNYQKVLDATIIGLVMRKQRKMSGL